ncbi:MAG TPA: hypothetical protein VJQ56_14110, partial [Blastocatellia bacterium]|nr:hypothetical protein [Blastocatellia bacterium]
MNVRSLLSGYDEATGGTRPRHPARVRRFQAIRISSRRLSGLPVGSNRQTRLLPELLQQLAGYYHALYLVCPFDDLADL